MNLSDNATTLKKTAEFDFVYKNAFKFFHKHFVLYSINLDSISAIKYPAYKQTINSILLREKSLCAGFSISKKIGKAAVRNLLKRRLKSICKDYSKTLYSHNGSCRILLFVPKVGILESSFKELQNDVLFAIKHSNKTKSAQKANISNAKK